MPSTPKIPTRNAESALAWSLAGVCRIYSSEWLIDRSARGLIPEEKPVAKDRPITGAELKLWRLRRGFSQRKAASVLGVTNGAISQAEARPDEPLGPKLREAFRPHHDDLPEEPDLEDRTSVPYGRA